MTPLYFDVMAGIHALENGASSLFVIEGSGQTNYPGINWFVFPLSEIQVRSLGLIHIRHAGGDGFITDGPVIAQYKLSDANQFFGCSPPSPTPTMSCWGHMF